MSPISLILEFMGNAGKSGSTRYSIINSLGNLPVQYMILADGWGGDRFGVRVVAATECVLGFVGIVSFLAWLLIKRPIAPVDEPATVTP